MSQNSTQAIRVMVLIALICPALFSTSAQGRGQARTSPLSRHFDGREALGSLEQAIRLLMNQGDVPGLSIVLIRNGAIYWHRGFGVMNAETNEPVRDDTVFEAASLSKSVFAYAVLKLVDSGKLNLDTPLASYLSVPYLPSDKRISVITARMVLAHTTGFQNEASPRSPLKIHFGPGEKFSYSGEGFLYLQTVVERITDEPLEMFIKKTVFEPLGMTSSSFVWQDRFEALKANGHKSSGVVAQRRKPASARSASGLHTTAIDYAKFVIAVINGTGLSSKTSEQMLREQIRLDETCFSCINRPLGRLSTTLSWGLGWGLEITKAGRAIWHWGDNNAEFHNFVIAYPSEKTGAVIMTNSGNGHSIIPEILFPGSVADHPAFAWMGYEPYNSPSKILFRAILIQGTAALERYRQTRNTKSGTILSETQVNSLGYWLLGKKKFKEAIEVFRMNTEDFPRSSNAYDSLGEAYMLNGDAADAIRSYQKSLDLDPNNTNAVEMLKKLRIQ